MNWSMYEPLIMITWIIGLFVLITAGIYLLAGIKNRNKHYRERIRELEKQLEDLRELNTRQKEYYERELKRLTKISDAMRSLFAALEEGVIELRHTEDGGRVTLLLDGTLVCEKRHIVYPKSAGADSDG